MKQARNTLKKNRILVYREENFYRASLFNTIVDGKNLHRRKQRKRYFRKTSECA